MLGFSPKNLNVKKNQRIFMGISILLANNSNTSLNEKYEGIKSKQMVVLVVYKERRENDCRENDL